MLAPERLRVQQEDARSPGEIKVERALLRAFARVRALLDDLVERADRNDGLDVVGLVTRLDLAAAFAPLTEDLTEIFAASIPREARTAADESDDVAKEVVVPDLIDQLAHELALTQAATLVRGISASTRLVLRETVARALRENMTVPQLARAVRDNIGLTARQARVVDKLRKDLVSRGVAGPALEAKLDRRAEILRRQRAQMIARTEMQFAQNGARFQEWAMRVQAGMLDQRILKRWIAKDPCKACIALAKSPPLPLTTPFYSSVLRKSVMHPPAHPNCKCSVGLVLPPRATRR